MSGECDLHEMSNCAFCNGSDARLKKSLAEPEVDLGPVSQNPGGVTIRAQFYGTCDGCGFTISPGEPIFRPANDQMGWVRVDCCLGIALGS